MAEEEKGFVIRDKRRFTEEGDSREESAERVEPEPAAESPPQGKAKEAGQQAQGAKGPAQGEPGEDAREEMARAADRAEAQSRPDAGAGGQALPEVNFPTFVLSLSSSVMFHLGELADPATGQRQKDLAMAKHTIDIMAMLEEKTRGNLSEDEQRLLSSILYDLRMAYVRAARG
ncbi:MAG: DUF1844 domain-containing protein [Desulfatibacillaceae bacterium]